MDTLMPVITALSLLAALVSTAVAVRVTRDERRRRAARVAALAAAAGLHDRRAAEPEVPSGLHEFMPAREVEGADAAHAPIFTAPIADSGSGGRQHRLLLAAAAVVGVVVLGGAATLVLGGRHTAAAAATARPPLELVTLGHQRSDAGLAVSGEVRNPDAAPSVADVQAEVRVFDAAGILIASQTALVETRALAPGQSSPFAIPVGSATTAARYRVSFSSAGTMLPHVDRRTNLPAAVTADAR
ncbi:MAG: FxLYD domain-containing protein [Vicinamibacterales bacterium]